MADEPEQPAIAYGVLTSHDPANESEPPPTPPETVPPVNRDVPLAYQAVDKLTVTMGNWDNMQGEPHSYAYQWRREGIVIMNAVSSDLTITSTDIGYRYDCTVSATNSVGSASVDSNVVVVAPF